ncbi:MAG: hypothetical protein O2955_09560 [Planctomycetota bacterium]|nr:hypothetical protein [Planctomycetota bacterium]MDA1212756.1 hypothetical protein [Planctomycetota bacterium]
MKPNDEFDALTQIFPSEQAFALQVEHIPSALTPEPYKQLLVHDHHMTVTMEQFYDCKVHVHVLQKKRNGNQYSRKIVLTNGPDGPIVQFGLVRFNFDVVTQAVRDEILSEKIPLGRVLITHNVLRHIDLGAILRITAGPGLAEALKIDVGETTYGRLATIFCNHLPAVDLLEICAPVK